MGLMYRPVRISSIEEVEGDTSGVGDGGGTGRVKI